MYPYLPIAILVFVFLIFWAGFYFLFAGVLRSLRVGAKHIADRIFRSQAKHWAVGKYPRLKGARQYLPIFVILTIGLIMTFIAGDLFLDLAEDFQRNESVIYKADR